MQSLALKTLVVLTVVWMSSQQCSENVLLPNIIKDSVTLNYFNAQESSSSYPYFSRMFSAQPVVTYSISQIDIRSTGNYINYYLDVLASSVVIDIYFNAPNQTWNSVVVNLWITSRQDLIVRQDTLKNVAAGTNATQVILLSQYNATLSGNPKHLTFLVGMYVNLLSQNLTVKAESGGINPSFATVLIVNGLSSNIVNITVSSIIFDPDSSQFLSHSGTLTYQAFSLQSYNLFTSFMPIYYQLVGLSAISAIGTNSKAFSYQAKIDNTILSLKTIITDSSYESVTFTYFTISIATLSICQNCNNNFISSNGCVQACPANTFSYTFTDGAKACVECPSSVGVKINDISNGCSCLPGYEYLTDWQCVQIADVSTICTGQNVIQNGTSCICAPGTYNISGQCQTCPDGTTFNGVACQQTAVLCTQSNTQLDSTGTTCVCITGYTNYSGVCRVTCAVNSAYNSLTGLCECNPGFMDVLGVCQPCKSSQSYDASLKTCRCNSINQVINSSTGECRCQDGFYNVSNFCIACPDGTIYQNGICSPTSCPANQILVDGLCVCDSVSVKLGNGCIKCQSGTFANKNTQACDRCVENCQNCTTALNCLVCNQGYVYDFSTGSCLSNGGRTSSVQGRNGFPIYTTTAIITDLDIDSAGQLAVKTKQQLTDMITVDFGGVVAPYRTLFAQNPSVLNRIRVTLDYRGLLPIQPFNLTYRFQESSLGLSSSVKILYNVGNAALVNMIPE